MEQTSIDIIKILRDAGHQAYWAGGCVRDLLLGKDPQDYDIVTSAKPEEVEGLLEKTIPIGKSFGVIQAIKNGHHYEIATFRTDSETSDGRRPDNVVFTHPEEDAFRRDFTVNGMFYDPITKEVIDYVGGQEDLKNKLIRFIGKPVDRIREDYLRILRAVRFKNTLGFMYHPDTYHALVDEAGHAGNVAQERVRDELNKMLIHESRCNALEDLSRMGIMEDVLPEIEAMKGVAQPHTTHQEGDVYNHTIACMEALPTNPSLELVWGVLLHDAGKPDTFAIKERIRFDHHSERSREIAGIMLRRLRMGRQSIKKVQWLVVHHFMMVQLLEMPEGRRRHWYTHDWFPDLLEVFRCDAMGQKPIDMSLYNKVEDSYKAAIAAMPPSLPKLLSGEDIQRICNLKPGPQIGKILTELRELQLEGKIKTKAEAQSWVQTKA